MNDTVKTYIFNYWSGHGIGGIWQHTIEFYPLKVRANSDEDAIEKALLKAGKLGRYNKIFYLNNHIPVIVGNKIGVCFLNHKKIVWQGEKLYWKGVVVDENIQLQEFILPSSTYPTVDKQWCSNYCTGRAIPSIEEWKQYCRERLAKSSLLNHKL